MDLLRSLPLWRSLSRLRPLREPGTALLYLLILLCAIVVGALPIVRPVQDEFFRAYHLRASSTTRWCAVQVLPQMYGGANRAWISRDPLTEEQLRGTEPLPENVRFLWTNHYPARVLTFGDFRVPLSLASRPHHVYLDSRYRGTHIRTHWTVRPAPPGIQVLPAGETSP